MVNQGRVLKTEKISEVNHPTGLAREILLVETPQVVIGHQLQTGAEETWRPVVTHLAGMLVVVGAIQCSPGSQALLMVWIKAGETPKCRVIVAVPVARACHHHMAAEVAAVEVAEVVSPAEAVVVHEVVLAAAEAVAAEAAVEVAVAVAAVEAEGR
jgi:hypothetical protein